MTEARGVKRLSFGKIALWAQEIRIRAMDCMDDA